MEFVITRRNGDQYTVFVDDGADWDLVSSYQWYIVPPCDTSKTAYARGYKKDGRPRKGKKLVFLHSLLMDFPEKGTEVDHINRNGLDNRRLNLRLVTSAGNKRNRKRIRPKYNLPTGVTFVKLSGRFQALIQIEGKQNYLGCYDTPQEASEVYQEAYKKRIRKEIKKNLNYDNRKNICRP